MKNLINLKAQLTVEYLLLFTLICIAIITMALTGGSNGSFQGGYMNILKERALTMEATTYDLDGSNAVEPALGNPNP